MGQEMQEGPEGKRRWLLPLALAPFAKRLSRSAPVPASTRRNRWTATPTG